MREEDEDKRREKKRQKQREEAKGGDKGCAIDLLRVDCSAHGNGKHNLLIIDMATWPSSQSNLCISVKSQDCCHRAKAIRVSSSDMPPTLEMMINPLGFLSPVP